MHPESQENGQKEVKRSKHEDSEEEEGVQGDKERTRAHEEKDRNVMETQSPSHTSRDVEMNTGNGNCKRCSSSSIKLRKMSKSAHYLTCCVDIQLYFSDILLIIVCSWL